MAEVDTNARPTALPFQTTGNQHPLAASAPRRIVCPHKKTDFRHALWVKERKSQREKARRTRFRVERGRQPKGNTVTVDTSKARSNIDVIRLCLKELNWREYPVSKRDGTHCDIHWHGVQYVETPDLYSGRVNKFPGMVEVVRKVSLTRTLDIMKNLFPEEYDFHPQSWFLPHQFADFSDAARRATVKSPKRKPVYIVKPDEGSQGEGIYLISDPKEYTFNNKQHVVQEYLADPLLLEDLKFDLRIYAVLSNLDPLHIQLHTEGLARFCTVPYQRPSSKNFRESYMHLTNYSLNKYSSTYVHTDTDDDGSKRTMTSVFRKLECMGYDTKKIWTDIEKLVVKTILAVAPELKVEMNAAIPPGKPGPKPFQILGFDIILTETLKPMLLEVNANPSLRIDYESEIAPGIYEYLHSPVDEEIKKPLVLNTLLLVAPKKKKRSKGRGLSSSASNVNCSATSRDEDTVSYGREEALPLRSHKHMEQTTRHPRPPQDGHRANLDPREIHTERLQNGVKVESTEDVENIDPSQTSGLDDEGREIPREPIPEMKEIYPGMFAEDYKDLLLMEKTVEIFLSSLGVRGSLRMGATSFRNFTRKGKLVGGGPGFSNAALDILFIDIQRRWEYMNPQLQSGLCYQGFLEAFFMIAQRKFPASSPLESVKNFLSHCDNHIETSDTKTTQNNSATCPQLPRLDRVERLARRAEELKKLINQTHRHHPINRLVRQGSCVLDFRSPQSPPSSADSDSARSRYSQRSVMMSFVGGKE